MSGVYCYNTFFDELGREHKIELWDSAFGGSSVEVKTAAPGYSMNIDGITEEIMFTPRFRQNVSVFWAVEESSTELISLFENIINAKENQYYIKIYRKISGSFVLIFIGRVIPDQTQGDDDYPFTWEMRATDGLGLLDESDFEFATDGNVFDYATDLEIVTQCLEFIGNSQFFGTLDTYIKSSVDFWEDSQRTTRGPLFDTRRMKAGYVKDTKELVPYSAGEVLDMVLATYGANIRFDKGCWLITQPINWQGTDNINYFRYTKSGTYSSDAIEIESVTISGSNTPTEGLVDSWKPMLKNVQITVPVESMLEVNKVTPDRQALSISSHVGVSAGLMTCPYDIQVNTQSNKRGFKFYSITLQATIAGYNLVSTSPTFSDYSTMRWVSNGAPVIRGLHYNYPIYKLNRFTSEFATVVNYSGAFYFPPPPVDGTITVQLQIRSENQNTADDGKWTGKLQAYQLFDNGTNEDSVAWQSSLATLTDASYQIKTEQAFTDLPEAFAPAQLQIYNGSAWQASVQWGIGPAPSTVAPINQLLCQEAFYFQRFPRQMVQGIFRIDNYYSQYAMNWRGSSWMLLSGRYDAMTGFWDGVWIEIARDTTGTESTDILPHLEPISKLDRDLSNTDRKLQDLGASLESSKTDIDNLSSKVKALEYQMSYGVDGFLTNDVDGLDGGSPGTKLALKVEATNGGWKLIAE